MFYIFLINIILYFTIQLYKLKFISGFFRKENNLINPFVIVFLSQLPVDIFKIIVGPSFILEKGLSDKYYNIAIFYTTIAIAMDFLLLRFTFLVSSKYTFKSSTFYFKLRENNMKLVALVFYILFFLSFFLLASSSFGILNWLSNPRVGYQHHREGAGQFWVFAISFLSISFTISCIFIKKNLRLFIILPLFLISAYFLGSKGIILEFFIFFLIILWVRKFKYLKLMFFAGVPFALGLMLLNFFGGGFEGADLKDVFSYFDYYSNSAMYYKAYYEERLDLFYGQIYTTDFWNLVPRGLYPNKPYVYGITHVNEFFFPGAAEATNTPAFGGPVNYFADFGLLGVLLFSLLNPFKFISYFFLCQLLKNYNYHDIRQNSIILILFIIFTAPFFLSSLVFPLNMFFLFFCITLILFFNKISYRK